MRQIKRYITTTFFLICITLFTSCAGSKVGRKQAEFQKMTQSEWAKEPLKTPVKSGKKFNPDNAMTLARTCRLAWEKDKGAIAAVAKHWKVKHLFVDLRTTHSQYLLIGNSEYTILAYRATQARLKDLGTVLKFGWYETKPEFKDGVYGGIPSAAAGFRESVADCFSAGLIDDIKLFRKSTGAERAPLFITGHSLGGGLAVLTRSKLAKAGIHADSLYVFGCPVTVSPHGKSAKEYRETYSATNFFLRYPGDNVPRLRWKNIPYSPPGNSYIIHRDGRLTKYSQYKTLNAISSIGWSVPWLTNIISSHNIDKSYLPAIKASKEQ